MQQLREVLFLGLIFGLPPLSAVAGNDLALQRLLQKGIEKGYPGIAMITAGPDGVTSSAAVGFSSLESKTALRSTDGFHIASINKTLTAVAALRLVDQRRLSLGDTLEKLLGDTVERVPNADRITVAELLDHSSGIYATNNDEAYLATLIGAKADPCRVWKYPDLVALANAGRKKPSGEPGSGHYYADTNYVLLGMIVEKVSKRPFKQFVAETILKPLAMHHTYFYSDYVCSKRTPPVATVQGYLLATPDIRKVVAINPMFKPVAGIKRTDGELLNTTRAAERVDAAGGIVSTLPDMLKFASALFRGKLLSRESQGVLTAAVNGAEALPIGKHRTWALQAMHKSYGVVLYKEGDGAGGVNTLMAYLPAQDRIYIGFINVFGNFDEVDFMLDNVIGPMESMRHSCKKGTISTQSDVISGIVPDTFFDRDHDGSESLLGLHTAMRLGRLLHGVNPVDDRSDLAVFDHLPERLQLRPGLPGKCKAGEPFREHPRPCRAQHVRESGITRQVAPVWNEHFHAVGIGGLRNHVEHDIVGAP